MYVSAEFFPEEDINSYSKRKQKAWQLYELPNLSKDVGVVVVLHQRTQAKDRDDLCETDAKSFAHLERLNKNPTYYCCEIEAYSSFKSRDIAAQAVINTANNVLTAIQGNKSECACKISNCAQMHCITSM